MNISVTIATISAIGKATCSPVMICGSAAGKAICHSNSRSPAPILRADHNSSRSTPRMPMMVAVTTGKIASTAIIVILETS